MKPHRMTEVIAPRGLRDWVEVTCECRAWRKRFTTLAAAARAHERHALLERVRARKLVH